MFEVDKRTIIRRLKELEAEGFIEILKARNDVDGKIYRIIRIAGSKIQTKESNKEVTKMSPKGCQNCHQSGDKNVTQVIKQDNNIIYNRARARDNTQTKKIQQKKNGFCNFSQREYDMDKLEYALLNRSRDPNGDDGG